MDSIHTRMRDTGAKVRVEKQPAVVAGPGDVRARRRVVVERVWPEIDGGRFPIKRLIG